jgi:hypothetical protein
LIAQHSSKINDRGISESIGFMLIFSIVIAGIALVTLYGYPLLLQQQTSADEKIMEKNMIVLQNDIKSLAYKTVPFKETSLKIGGGSLTVYNSSYGSPSSKINIYDGGAGGASYLPPPYDVGTAKFTPGELRYESISAQTDISLQNGAVVLRPRVQKGSTILAEPRWFFDAGTNTMVINLIEITSTNILAKEGIGTVQMELVGEPYYKETVVTSGHDVRIDYTPSTTQDYSVAWDNYIMKIWNFPQGYKTRVSGTPGNGLGLPVKYRFRNPGSSDMILVIKIFKVNIKSI